MFYRIVFHCCVYVCVFFWPDISVRLTYIHTLWNLFDKLLRLNGNITFICVYVCFTIFRKTENAHSIREIPKNSIELH